MIPSKIISLLYSEVVNTTHPSVINCNNKRLMSRNNEIMKIIYLKHRVSFKDNLQDNHPSDWFESTKFRMQGGHNPQHNGTVSTVSQARP